MSVTDPTWLKAELSKPGRSQSALARAMGLDSSAINRLVNGDRRLLAEESAEVEAYLTATARESSPLADRLAYLMAAKGTNPYRLANDAGLDKDYVRNLLRGKSLSPGASEMAKVASALGVSLDDLLGIPAVPNPARDPKHPETNRWGEKLDVTINTGKTGICIVDGRVTLDIKANVSMGVAAQILALIEGDKE